MSAKKNNKFTTNKYMNMGHTENNFSPELIKMINSFNCNELITLMQFAQKPRSGKKADLVERAKNLVKDSCDMPIQIKIKEIYNQHCARLKSQSKNVSETESFPEKTVNKSLKRKWNNNDFEDTSSSSRSEWSPGNFDSESSLASTFSDMSDSPSLIPEPQIYIPPVNLKLKIKKSNIEKKTIPSQANPIPLPVAETSWASTFISSAANETTLIKLPFYDRISQIIKPTIIGKSNVLGPFNVYSFLLTQQDVSNIEKSRIWHADGVIDYKLQVLLRFAIKNTSIEQDDYYPPKMLLMVNNKVPTLPALIPSTKIGVEPKRPNRPINITPLLCLNPFQKNFINVKYDNTDLQQEYVISVDLSKQLTSSDLLQQLNQAGPRPANLTKNLIKEKMKASNDSEISATSLRISLSCPLSKMRLSIPIRSSCCSHLQCFDASTFIQMNEKKPSWMCPICDRPAKFDTLFIDGLFIEILSKVSETNDVQFTEDGEWLPIFPRKTKKKKVPTATLR